LFDFTVVRVAHLGFLLSFQTHCLTALFTHRFSFRCPYTNYQGFDEFMNVVLDDAEEVYVEKAGKEIKARRELG